ncbi:microfibril-associated glycoprotein 4-like [Argopecten irradians]|uniref:microfibril-associated glycoprotein 4-like n=1 Tax=Argopecten irradians TaxID=31199 RepID=UPI003723E099
MYFMWILTYCFLQWNYSALATNRSGWKRILSASDREFDSPNMTTTCADAQKCVIACHRTGYSQSLTFHTETNTCMCFDVDKSNVTLHSFQSRQGTLFYSKNTESQNSMVSVTYDSDTKTPCLELYDSGYTKDGIYEVTTQSTGVTFQVMCNMTAGGWTILQHRVNDTEVFSRNYQDYVDGFGSLHGEFWLGLEYIYIMTRQPRSVRFDLLKDTDEWFLLEYSSFTIDDSAAFYKLHVSGHVASAGMCTYTFTYNDGMEFHAKDRDRSSCASNRKGGWWFKGCTWLNINGGYGLRNTMATMGEYCNGYNYFTETVMSIR